MTNQNEAALTAPLGPEELEDRDRAHKALYAALCDAGRAPGWVAGGAADRSITITMFVGDDDIWGVVPNGELPTRDPAEPLRRYFKQRGVSVQVVVGDGVLKLILASAQDARRLTEIVALSMPPERKAAVRLREVFFAVGIGRRVDGSSITSGHGYVNIGDLDVQDALRLWTLIWGGTGPEEFDPYDMGWQRIEHLAERMEVAVSEACGGHVGVEPNAACNTCSGSRNDQITLGLATPEQANRLAARIEAAAPPTGTAGPA